MQTISPRKVRSYYKDLARNEAKARHYLEAFKYLQLSQQIASIPTVSYYSTQTIFPEHPMVFSVDEDSTNPSTPMHLGMLYGDANLLKQQLPQITKFVSDRHRGRSIILPFVYASWFPYRWQMEEQFPFFLDPPSNPLGDSIRDKLPIIASYDYCSVLQQDIDTVLSHCQKKYHGFIESGFKVRNFNPSNARSDLKQLYELSTASFRDNLYYRDISFEAFLRLYAPKLKSIPTEYLKFAESAAGETVGFLFSIPDYTSLFSQYNLLSISGKLRAWNTIKRKQISGIVHKSTAVAPHARGKGIESALIFAMTLQAKSAGAKHVIGAFASVENPSTRVLGQAQLRNLYRLYEIAPI